MLNTLGKQYPCVCLFAFFFVCVYGCGFIIMTDSLYTESIRMKKNNNWFKICESIFVFVDSIIICMLVITHNEYIWRIVILVVTVVVTVVVVVTIIADLYKFFFVLQIQLSMPHQSWIFIDGDTFLKVSKKTPLLTIIIIIIRHL